MSKAIINQKNVILFYGLFNEFQSYDWIPYGLLYLAAKIKSINLNPILIHEYCNRDYEETIKKYAKESVVFGVSAMSGYQIHQGIRAVKIFRKYAPETPVIWGGAHATAVPDSILQSKYADYVCVGPGIENFVTLLNHLLNDQKHISTIPYILDKNQMALALNNLLPLKYSDSKFDLSNFPPFPFDLLNVQSLLTENRVLNYTASFGCPLNCNFCSWGGAHTWNSLPVERVIDDLKYIVKQFNIHSLWFSDSTLCFKKEYVLSIAEGILKNNLNIYWRANASIFDMKRFTKNDLNLLERSGLDRLFVGIENVSRNIQKIMNKKFDPDICDKIFQDMKDFDIQIMVSLIFGNPLETIEDLELNRQYLSRWMKINPKVRFQICFFTPYPGTPMTNLAIKMGHVPPQTLKEYGQSIYFRDVERSKKQTIEWYSKDFTTQYLKRFNQLFPDADKYGDAEWNWRKKKEVVRDGY